MNFPNQRFVRIRLHSEKNLEHTLTFLMSKSDDHSENDDGIIQLSKSDDHSDPNDNGIIQHITQTDPGKAAEIADLLRYLKENEVTFFEWLERSPEHSMLFATDPVNAIKTALPDAPCLSILAIMQSPIL